MKKLFIILFGLIVVTAMVGCLNLTAIPPFLNGAPIIISEPIITATENNQYFYQLEVNDPEGDSLTYLLVLSPEGMSINSENGLITWAPTNNQVGIHQVVVEISDGKHSVTQSFKIEVSNMNNLPQIFSYFPGSLNVGVNEGDSIKFEVQAHDIDLKSTLSFQWFLDGKLVLDSTVSGDGSKSSWIYSAGYGDYGQKRVKVLVSDGELQDYVQWNITINDITPPAQPTLNTVTSPTNISSQTLSGTKEANSSILINDAEVVSINSSTDWSYSFALIEGENNILITSCDAVGNESTAVNNSITLDTIPPATPTLHNIISPTNICTQLLSGNKEINSSIWVNGAEVISVNSETTWSYDFELTEGENSILIISKDTAGNESNEINANIILDVSAPAIPSLDTVTSPTNISSQTLSGTKEANTSILINDTEVVSINSSTDWSYSYNLSEGTNNISITSRDAVGNESSAVTAIIVLDTINPVAPTLDAVVSPTNISPQTLSGTKETNTSIWINNIEVIPVNSSTTWTYDFNLSEGENNISITSQDSAGNESGEATVKIILDTISPTVPTLNEVIALTNVSIQVLFGTKETNTSIWLNGVEVVSLNSSTDWSYSYNLSEGNNNISVTSRDAAGNESSAILTIIEYDPNIYVDIGNTSGIEDGTQTHPFNSITEGIEAVASGKSVVVAAGTYNEQLIINKGIDLRGAGKESTFIIGLGYTGNLITVSADDVTISGFTIDGKSDTDIGIYSDSSSSIEISENLIQNHQDSGIFYQRISDDYPSGIYVYNNEICKNSLNGIKVTGAGSGIIEGNIIRNSNCGIKASNDVSLEVKKNNIYDKYDSGIFCRESSSLLIWENEIRTNSYGIRVGEKYSDTTNPDIGGGAKGGIGKNNITGNTSNGIINMTNHNIFAKYNWWGDDDGPKYPGNPNNANLSSDWAYWDNVNNKTGAIIFEDYLIEPQTF
ncbi:right-handed parallel beta-helix repeat-containing protein [bacterium]|nr:right-handed parallel beta-helix repeat-containing protein [bacterium]